MVLKHFTLVTIVSLVKIMPNKSGQFHTNIFAVITFLLTLCLAAVNPIFAADTVTISTKPGSGIAPMEVEILCQVSKTSSAPQRFILDFGDGAMETIESNKKSQAFSHTYESGYFRPVCRVETESTEIESSTGNVICGKWRFKTNGHIDSPPAIDPLGTVYIGSDDGNLYAIEPESGAEIWRFKTGGEIRSTPAIGPDKTIYVSSLDKRLYAIKPDGTLKWTFNVGDYMLSSPAMDSNGQTIYIGAEDGALYAVSSSLRFKWKFQTPGGMISTPSIGHDGIEDVVYFGASDRRIYAVSAATGNLKWSFPTHASECTSPVIDQNGRVYTGECRSVDDEGENFSFYCINPDGSMYWKLHDNSGFCSPPVIGPDGMIYVGSRNGTLFALNANGQIIWSAAPDPSGEILASPALGSNGVIYAGNKKNSFFSLQQPVLDETGDTGNQSPETWVFTTGGEVRFSSPVIDANGTIYFGCQDQYVYAINPGTMTPAQSPWPMFRQNPARTGESGAILIPDIISTEPAIESIDVNPDIAQIKVFFSPTIQSEDVDIEKFMFEQVSDTGQEIIEGYSSLDSAPYNNNGERAIAIFERLDVKSPLSSETTYTASIPYTRTTAGGTVEETFSWSFTTGSETENNPDTDSNSDSSCFLNTMKL
jgi:outer membrane protein assembly factor BamB